MRFKVLPFLAAYLAIAGCTSTVAQPVGPSQIAAKGPAISLGTGMVSAADPRAAEAGAEILRLGGSATDAALATLVALTVVEPQSSGIGGGGFLVHHAARGGLTSYDGRETAPMAAGGDWFFKDGKPLGGAEAVPGGRSVGVPGNVRMMALAHAAHGRLAWARLFDPAIRLARDGFAITPRLHRFLGTYRKSAALSAAGRALFYDQAGQPKTVGTVVRNPALASFLEMLAARGPDSFYVGPNAQAIAAAVRGAEQNPAPMTAGDLAAYDAKQRPPLCATYRAHRICGMAPPSSGATTVIAILKQLERFDMARLGKDSPTAWHLYAESTRLAFADRERYLADPNFAAVPAAGLIDPGYLAQRSTLIAPDRTMVSAPAGIPPGAPRVIPGVSIDVPSTSHFVAVDRDGNVANLTSTIESAFGSGLVVNGYYLNNELTDFSLVPSVDGVQVANRVEAGKRPRSSMAPTIVYGPDGKVRLAVGAAGGATIIAQVSKAIIAVIDWNLTAQQAITLPVLYAPGNTVFVERGTAHEAMIPALVALGHRDVRTREGFKANAIEWRDGHWAGAADPRSEGAVATE